MIKRIFLCLLIGLGFYNPFCSAIKLGSFHYEMYFFNDEETTDIKILCKNSNLLILKSEVADPVSIHYFLEATEKILKEENLKKAKDIGKKLWIREGKNLSLEQKTWKRQEDEWKKFYQFQLNFGKIACKTKDINIKTNLTTIECLQNTLTKLDFIYDQTKKTFRVEVNFSEFWEDDDVQKFFNDLYKNLFTILSLELRNDTSIVKSIYKILEEGSTEEFCKIKAEFNNAFYKLEKTRRKCFCAKNLNDKLVPAFLDYLKSSQGAYWQAFSIKNCKCGRETMKLLGNFIAQKKMYYFSFCNNHSEILPKKCSQKFTTTRSNFDCIINGIMCNNHIKVLIFAGNNLGVKDSVHLCNVVEMHKGIKYLSMQHNGILNTPATMRAICNMLTNRHLIDIRLNGNFFYTKGLIQILRNIQANMPERCSSPVKRQKIASFLWESQYTLTSKLRSLNLDNNSFSHSEDEYQKLQDIYEKFSQTMQIEVIL